MKICSVVFVFLLTGPVFAETVEQLVKRLDSLVFSDREDAQQQLFRLGPEIESLLPDMEFESISPEVGVRLKNLRRAFLMQSIDQSLDKVHFTLDSLAFQEAQSQMVARITVVWSDSIKEIRPIRWRFPLDFLGQSGAYDIPIAPGQTQVPLRFSWTVDAKEEKKPFHGKCQLLFAAGERLFAFPLSDGAESIIRQENAVVSLQGTVHDQRTGRLRIRFLVEYENALDAMQSHLIWMESNPTYLERETGQTIPPVGTVQQHEKAGNRFAGILTFRVPRDTPWKTYRFVYKTPTILAEKTVEYVSDETDR